MNLKAIRNVHLYLGCFFAPLLLVFIISGAIQTFELHHASKDGYQPPQIVKLMSAVHEHQRLPAGDGPATSSAGLRFFILAMAIGVLTTTILGILMAFQFTKPRTVWLYLLAGAAVPFFILLLRS